jgi:hypothetical protein
MDMRRFGDRARSRCCRSNMTHNIYVHQKISTFGELFCVSRTTQVGAPKTLDVQGSADAAQGSAVNMPISLVILILAASLQFSPAFHCSPAVRNGPTAIGAQIRMAGFGAPAGGKSAKPVVAKTELSPKRQWDKFKELVADGSPRHRVFVQLDDKWTEVGDLAVAPPGTPAQAAQYNKRLIMEHASRVAPALALRSTELKLGIEGENGEPVLLTKQEVPDKLMCGFEGEADASGKYKSIRGTSRNSDPTTILGKSQGGAKARK